MNPPAGKGLFVWIVSRCAGGNPVRLAQMAVQAGLGWVALKIHDASGEYNGDLRGHVAALKAAGISVWGWGYVYGVNVSGEARIIARRTAELGLDGYFLNAEKEWKQPGMAVRASLLVNEVRAGLSGKAVGLCSYRYPSLHPQFPWRQFLDGCDFHAPQVYWLENDDPNAPATQLGKSLGELRAVKDLPVVPLGVASPNDPGTWWPTAAQLDNFYTGVVAQGLAGWGWWEWGHAERRPELWDRIAAHGSAPPPGISALARDIRALAEMTLQELG